MLFSIEQSTLAEETYGHSPMFPPSKISLHTVNGHFYKRAPAKARPTRPPEPPLQN